jgi:uncharacterized protein (DUF2336 family)
MLARSDLPLDIRQTIAATLARSLAVFATDSGWLSPERAERAMREARDKATLSIVASAGTGDLQGLIEHLRASDQLTPALILRAILSRRIAFAEAALADLAGLPLARVAGMMRQARGGGFAALYERAGLPASLKPAFIAALCALAETAHGTPSNELHLSRRMVERVLAALADLPGESSGKLTALLRRFEVEAARDEARGIAEALADDAALALVRRYAPAALIEHAPQRISAA